MHTFSSTGENFRHFQVAALLDIPVYQYAEQARQIDHMFKALCEDAGLLPEYNEFSECNTNQ
jgi:hypothetical protein